ncbi:TPA: hypothetical protein ACNAIT_003810, partial [Escherichia coli]
IGKCYQKEICYPNEHINEIEKVFVKNNLEARMNQSTSNFSKKTQDIITFLRSLIYNTYLLVDDI